MSDYQLGPFLSKTESVYGRDYIAFVVCSPKVAIFSRQDFLRLILGVDGSESNEDHQLLSVCVNFPSATQPQIPESCCWKFSLLGNGLIVPMDFCNCDIGVSTSKPVAKPQSLCNHLRRTTGYFHVLKAPSVLCKSLNVRFRADSIPTAPTIA